MFTPASFRRYLLAFTMVELLATIAILAVMLAVVVPMIGNYVSAARNASYKQNLAVLNDALNRYKMGGGDLAALTYDADIENVITALKTPIAWNGLNHQFLRDGMNVPAQSLEAYGSGQSYRFYKYGDYMGETPPNGEPTSDAPGGYGWLIAQGFEGVGYDNGEAWVTITGDPSPDNVEYPYDGAHELYTDSSSDIAQSPYFADQNEVWFYFTYVCGTLPTTTRDLAVLVSSSNTYLMSLICSSGGSLSIRNGGASSVATGVVITIDTRYHIWGRYKAGTGANSEMDIWISTSTTKPGSPTVSNTTGPSTAAAAAIRFGQASPGSPNSHFDRVRVSASSINSAP